MSDEGANEWRDDVLPDKTISPARERRARRQFGSSRTPYIGPDREYSTIDRTDLYAFPAPSPRLLQEFFKLTPAETKLAQYVARAETIEDAAYDLGIRLCTARSQLASIFEKTGTARQAELVALLSRLAHLSQSSADGAPVVQKPTEN